MRATRGIVTLLVAGLGLSLSAPAAWGVLTTSSSEGTESSTGDASTAPAANPETILTFLAALPHRAAALEQAATAISTPGSPSFREYLSVEEAAERYGATSAQITAVRKAARSLGLTAQIDPTRLIARISGPVTAWEKAMGTAVTFTPARPGAPYDTYVFPRPKSDQGSLTDPDFWRKQYESDLGVAMGAPAGLARTVTALVAAYREYVPTMDVPVEAGDGGAAVTAVTDHVTARHGEPTPRSIYGPGDFTQVPPTNPAAGLMRSCINQPGAPLGPQSLLGQPLTPADFVGHEQVFGAYGLSALQRREGANASGRVTIISIGGGYSDADLAEAAKCFGYTQPEVRITRGTGVGSPFVNIDAETTLDVQTVSSTLKNARAIQLVQVASPDLGVAFVDGYSRALTATPRPHAITLSYGSCEPLVARFGMFPTVGTLFQFAAAVGTTITVSSGDAGSSSCQDTFGEILQELLTLVSEIEDNLPNLDGSELAVAEDFIAEFEKQMAPLLSVAANSRPTVDFPASSPWATAVGGTQIVMNPDGSREAEVVWNDQPYSGGKLGNMVGGGGLSAAFNAPAYQRPLTWSNTRAVPDISALSSPFPSLPIVLRGTISEAGGTSQASPMMAAAFALLSAHEVSQGRPRLGFINPWLYNAVRRHPQTVYDVTIGDNQLAIPLDLEGTSLNIPACCQADVGFDQATGLGVLNFSELRKHITVR